MYQILDCHPHEIFSIELKVELVDWDILELHHIFINICNSIQIKVTFQK